MRCRGCSVEWMVVSALSRPVILIAEKLAPSVLDVFGDEFDVQHVDGADRHALFEALVHAEALLVRSATRVDAEALSRAPRLKVVARAGVGLANTFEQGAAHGCTPVTACTRMLSAASKALAPTLKSGK